MIVSKKISDRKLDEFFQGDYKLGGKAGSNGAGSPILTDAAATFQTDGVAIGDRVYVSGALLATVYTVLTVDSQTQLTLSANIVAAHVGNLTYRVHRNNGYGDPATLKLIYPLDADMWFVMWDSATFGHN